MGSQATWLVVVCWNLHIVMIGLGQATWPAISQGQVPCKARRLHFSCSVSSIKFCYAMSFLLQDNYPEMLNIKLFVNVPRALEVLFSVLTSLSDASTRRKMQMVSTARTRAALQQHIDPAQLLARYARFT